MREMHNNLTSGHLGMKKALSRLQKVLLGWHAFGCERMVPFMRCLRQEWTKAHMHVHCSLPCSCTNGEVAVDIAGTSASLQMGIVNWIHTGKTDAGSRLRLPVDLLDRRPPDEELPEETTSYVRRLQIKLTEVHHQGRGALEFSGELMKRSHDVKASQVCYKDESMRGPYTVVERLADVTYRIKGRREAQPKVVHVNRQPPTTDEDQTCDLGRTNYRTDSGNPTMEQGRGHCSRLVELDMAGEGDRFEDVTEVAAPRGL
ncbi:hypothetical protein Hamer_G028998 [Homarus americanus]|uniref:Integrase p58-like C-terminal domain-containing protein n=1 Tax=Homarus americanus TaxID=6706 RepID=A0A8J5KAC3_HOMAM|nr:hypothetical protein Hamer_G028998 [Homarus americanus]